MSHVVSPSPVTAPDAAAVSRVQRKIRKLVCSAPWFEVCWAEYRGGRLKDQKRADHALDRAKIYPPGGAPRRKAAGQPRPTLMRRCAACTGRWYPPQYIKGCGLCEECAAAVGVPVTDERTHVPSTHSPTAEALRRMEHYQTRIVESRLAAEDEASLRREIVEHTPRRPGNRAAPLKNTKKHSCMENNAVL